MSQEFGTPSTPPPVSSPSWSEVWTNALTRPSVATFEGFVQDPNATPGRACTWVFVSSLTSLLFSVVFSTLLVAVLGPKGLGEQLWSMYLALILGPVIAAFTLIVFMIIAGITQLIAGALGGTGMYSELVYAFAAYMAPLTLIQLTLIQRVLSPIPLITYLQYALWIYGIVLNVIAVKAVHKFGWGKAIASSAVFVGILALVVGVVIGIGYLAVLFMDNLTGPHDPKFKPYTLLPLGPVVGKIPKGIESLSQLW